MKRNRVTNELSEQLKAELKAVPLVSAPNELWTRVSTELSSGADELKVKYFPYRRALATAAALIIFFGITFQLIWPSYEWRPELSPVIDDLAKEELRSRVIFMEVAAVELSPLARDIAFSLGGVDETAIGGGSE